MCPYNCLDRNVDSGNAEKVAIIFEADDGTVTKVTYRELLRVCRSPTASARSGSGSATVASTPINDRGRGRDAGLCAHRRHAFGRVRRLSAKPLQERIIDAGAVAVITADEQQRRKVPP
jgi:acetyl-CoA synthetase